MYIRVRIAPLTNIYEKDYMKHAKKVSEEKSISIERPLTRHESWRNHRRHMDLKLIKFS